jgi:hypothetical protein
MDGSGTLFADFVSALGSKSLAVSYPPDRALSSRINPRCKVVQVEGPHAMLQTNPNACASAVKRLLNMRALPCNQSLQATSKPMSKRCIKFARTALAADGRYLAGAPI